MDFDRSFWSHHKTLLGDQAVGVHPYHSANYSRSVKVDKWDYRFLEVARLVSTWSKDPSTKIGCVAVDPETRRILSTGYNGFPKGIRDDARLEDREKKYKLIIHAEMNAVYNATQNGISLQGTTFYVTGLPPCSQCAKGLVQVGVKRIAYDGSLEIPDRWKEDMTLSKSILDEAGVWLYGLR